MHKLRRKCLGAASTGHDILLLSCDESKPEQRWDWDVNTEHKIKKFIPSDYEDYVDYDDLGNLIHLRPYK